MHLKRLTPCLFALLFIGLVGCRAQAPAPEQVAALDPAVVHQEAITLDTHVDISGPEYATAELDPGKEDSGLKCDLVKMTKGGLDGVFLAVYVAQRPELNAAGYKAAYESAIGKFEAIHRLTEQMYPDRAELALTPDDVERISKTSKRAIMIGIENGYPIGEDLSLIQKFYDMGARYITLSHSGHNQICDSSGPDQPMHNGLSEFGKQVVGEMNRLGIIIDVSHISKKSFWDVIEVSKAPIMASHSGCAALNEHNRNLDDDQLKALTKNGGVIQIVALGSFLKADSPERTQAMAALREEIGVRRVSPEERRKMTEAQQQELEKLMATFQARMAEIDQKFPGATLTDYVDHIDHAVKVAGIDHVGIGTDFDGGGGIPGFNDHSEALNVTRELVKRGYSADDIKKIWGQNLLRVWRQVNKVAAEAKATN